MKKNKFLTMIICFAAALLAAITMSPLATAKAYDVNYAIDKTPVDSIDYYHQKHGSLEYVTVEITLTQATVNKLNADAVKALADTESSYTVSSYFDKFASYTATSPTLCKNKTDVNGNLNLVIYFADAYSSWIDENDDYSIEKGFYRVKYDVDYVNPLVKLKSRLEKYAEQGARGYDDWQHVLACGYLSLPAITKVFPSLKTTDWSKVALSYNRDLPKMYGGGNEDAQTVKSGVKYLTWRNSSENWQKLSYSYYRPYSLGWGITIVAAALLVAGIIILASKKSKQKPAFADYRPLTEAETTDRIESRISGAENTASGSENSGTYAQKADDRPLKKDGYAGHGVFRENGKTVDVFGNDALSAPEEKNEEENDK